MLEIAYVRMAEDNLSAARESDASCIKISYSSAHYCHAQSACSSYCLTSCPFWNRHISDQAVVQCFLRARITKAPRVSCIYRIRVRDILFSSLTITHLKMFIVHVLCLLQNVNGNNVLCLYLSLSFCVFHSKTRACSLGKKIEKQNKK